MKEKDQTQIILDILSSKWTTRIVRTLGNDTRRFSEIQKALPDTKQKVLTETLRKLERNGIVERKSYPVVPPQVEYKLTSIGLDLLQLSGVLSNWIAIHEEEIVRSQKSYDRRNRV